MKRTLCLLLFLAMPGVAPAPGDSGSEVLERLEARLLQARVVRVEASLRATGAVQATLEGFTELRGRNHAQARYEGRFAGAAALLTLAADGRQLQLGNAGRSRTLPVGADSNRALLLGLTRMGLWHNLTRAVALEAPDHDVGGFGDWSVADNFRPVTFAQVGELAGLATLGFDLQLDGRPTASVQLWLEPASGLPRRREQTLQLPAGEVRVVETYTRFAVE